MKATILSGNCLQLESEEPKDLKYLAEAAKAGKLVVKITSSMDEGSVDVIVFRTPKKEE